MITTANLENLLRILGFSKSGTMYQKSFPQFSCSLKVDFSSQRLIYPDSIKGRERNDGFGQSENFVVFECVNRLLEKGYRPEHIELEKEWHLGHNPKSGRADICVSAPDGSMLFIIECKTYGQKYDRAYKDTRSDGGQLFSYWQQERAAKWLILYASDLSGSNLMYKASTINCTDDPNIVALSKKDKSIRLYATAYTAEEKFAVWKETYSLQEHGDLVFSSDSTAYQIGIKPLFKKDLRDFSPEDKIVNRFEEILRHNNVSDKENAFNRLVALFICKLVDESTKGENDTVEFQYKQGTDTYETLQDRLQRLHQEGMEKFMREKIFYVPADYPEWLFATYTGQQRQKAIDDLREKIRILKFYSNNDFSFQDVHNEELFYQNGKVLVEVVQLFEKYRIVYPSKHQFLGDLFEQLLNKGFKQNEGQFFTPMPITRFIWDSLPVYSLTHSEQGTTYPKVIDYACGAGHFLTEAVEAINTFAENNGDNSWVRDHIFGIEKDYRLARVSKISLFMNGAGEGNIIFGDGLENVPDKQIEHNSFDVLVANPPYSVAAFKQHLSLKNNSFELWNRIGENGSEIEVLFVERIAQLLKPNGIAAVILPLPLFSKDSPSSYVGAREQILQNFYIRAVVQLGGKTFSATGQETVILFLEKFNEPPKKWDLISDSAKAILSGDDLSDWIDEDIFKAYLKVIDISEDEYSSFVRGEYTLRELSESGYFKLYADMLLSSPDVKNLMKSKAFLRKSQSEQEEAILYHLYRGIKSIEYDKICYFAITYQQRTLVILSPNKDDEQKDFLGYKWSNAKGREGIKILKAGGKLYDDNDRAREGTLASLIRRSFTGDSLNISEENRSYAGVVETYNMMDYTRASFNKALKLYAKRISTFQSKYPLCSLGSLSDEPKYGANEPAIAGNPEEDPRYIRITDITEDGYLGGEWMTSENIDEQYILQDEDFLFARTGATAGKTFLYEEKMGRAIYAGYLIRFRFHKTSVLPKYVDSVLRLDPYREWAEFNRRGRNINAQQFAQFKIPVPPLPVQQQIIDECATINEKYSAIRTSIEANRGQIKNLFENLERADQGERRLSLSDEEKFEVFIGKRVLNTGLIPGSAIPVFSANVKEPFGYVEESFIHDFSQDSVLWGIDGDWMVSYYPKDQPFYPTDHCGVLRIRTDEVNPRYMAHVLEAEGQKMNFSRSYRASMDRIQSITFSVPNISLQNDAMEQVILLEGKIKEAKKELIVLGKQKSEIIQKSL